MLHNFLSSLTGSRYFFFLTPPPGPVSYISQTLDTKVDFVISLRGLPKYRMHFFIIFIKFIYLFLYGPPDELLRCAWVCFFAALLPLSLTVIMFSFFCFLGLFLFVWFFVLFFAWLLFFSEKFFADVNKITTHEIYKAKFSVQFGCRKIIYGSFSSRQIRFYFLFFYRLLKMLSFYSIRKGASSCWFHWSFIEDIKKKWIHSALRLLWN